MQPTPRLTVLSDKIPQVLVFVYFCRGLSGNTEERPTRPKKYGRIPQGLVFDIEILTCRAILRHLEDSRSHGNEREGERARGRAPAHPPWAPAQEL